MFLTCTAKSLKELGQRLSLSELVCHSTGNFKVTKFKICNSGLYYYLHPTTSYVNYAVRKNSAESVLPLWFVFRFSPRSLFEILSM